MIQLKSVTLYRGDQCLLTDAPSSVDEKQLRELHIRLRNTQAA